MDSVTNKRPEVGKVVGDTPSEVNASLVDEKAREETAAVNVARQRPTSPPVSSKKLKKRSKLEACKI